MSKLLLASTWTHLIASTFAGLLIVASAVVIGEAPRWQQWRAEQQEREATISALRSSGLPQLCEKLYNGTIAPEAALPAGTNDIKRVFGEAPAEIAFARAFACDPIDIEWDDPGVRKRGGLWAATHGDHSCEQLKDPDGVRQYVLQQLGCDIVWTDDATLHSFVDYRRPYERSIREKYDPMETFGAFLAFSAVIFCALLAAKLVKREVHLGWRRLTLVATPLISLFAAASVALLAEFEGDVFGGGLITFIGVLLAAPVVSLGGRRCVLWIRRGFDQAEHPARNSSPSTGSELSAPRGEANRRINAPTTQITRDAHTPARSKLSAADFWPRAAARTIDLCLVLFLASMLAPTDFRPDIPSQPTAQFLLGKFFWLVWLSIFVIGYDVLFLSTSGRTPGKWFLGLEVISSKRTRLSAADAWKRERDLMTFGLYWMLLFPFVQIIGAIRASKDLSKLRTTEWDRKLGSAVVQHQIGEFRRAFGIVLAAVLLVVVIIGQQIAKDETRREWRDIYFGRRFDLPRSAYAVETRSCKLSALALAPAPPDLRTTCLGGQQVHG